MDANPDRVRRSRSQKYKQDSHIKERMKKYETSKDFRKYLNFYYPDMSRDRTKKHLDRHIRRGMQDALDSRREDWVEVLQLNRRQIDHYAPVWDEMTAAQQISESEPLLKSTEPLLKSSKPSGVGTYYNETEIEVIYPSNSCRK
jgi:hypothetical protein